MEIYAVAAFRSRQAVLRFDDEMRKVGIDTHIITTPRSISMGCGLSVRFDRKQLSSAIEIYREHPSQNLIGFYIAEDIDGRVNVSSVRL